MSELPATRAWLALADAARHLADASGKNVDETEVLRQALEGRLRLAIRIGHQVRARCGKVIRYNPADLQAAIQAGALPDDWPWQLIPLEELTKAPGFPIPAGSNEKAWTWRLVLRIDDERYLVLNETVTAIEGIWELPMIGDERLYVERVYQLRTGAPTVALPSLYGAFLAGPDGQLCQLQEHCSDNDLYQKRPPKQPWDHPDNFHPAGGLPADSALLVDSDALRDLAALVVGNPAQAAQPPAVWEPGTGLAIIATPAQESDSHCRGQDAISA